MAETSTYSVIHAVVSCHDCGWESASYKKNAQALAAQHSRKYGHKVTGELGIAISYVNTVPQAAGRRKGDK
jgi:hypothetical protein